MNKNKRFSWTQAFAKLQSDSIVEQHPIDNSTGSFDNWKEKLCLSFW